MQAEIDLVTLSQEEWMEMRRSAAELDLIHGGYFRARPRSILFYCDPENAPESWRGPFTEGTPEAPRALVGEAEVLDGFPDTVEVRLVVSNWAAMKAVKDAYDRGEYRGRWSDFVMDQETAFRGREADREWLRVRFARLRGHALGNALGD